MNITRRSFTQLAALGAATQIAPAQNERSIGYCIVGLGRISMQHFMPGTRLSKYSRVTAIVSGHRDKAEKWAADYGVPARSIYSYDTYDAIATTKTSMRSTSRCPIACMRSTPSAPPKPASTS